jgi:hypothetical protein
MGPKDLFRCNGIERDWRELEDWIHI